VILRWDSPDPIKRANRVQFPIDTADEAMNDCLSRLMHDCQPASFGLNGDDVLDETYRKAAKMNRSSFAIDFCPYEVGIIDTIAQMLLPTLGGCSLSGVRAELYKLNVSSMPVTFRTLLTSL
jgi:hypothetical protein